MNGFQLIKVQKEVKLFPQRTARKMQFQVTGVSRKEYVKHKFSGIGSVLVSLWFRPRTTDVSEITQAQNAL